MDDRVKALQLGCERALESLPQVRHILCVGCPPLSALPLPQESQLDSLAPWRDMADAWDRISGAHVIEQAMPEYYDLVLLMPPKQRDQGRAELAMALQCLKPDGILVAVAANKEGSGALQKDMTALNNGEKPESLSKFKCRILTMHKAAADGGMISAWHAAGQVQPVLDGAFVSQPGLFSWDRVDSGSAFLASLLPEEMPGEGADFGCGWGWLAVQVADKGNAPTRLHIIDADRRALALSERNLKSHGFAGEIEAHWVDLRQGPPVKGLDWIVMNPPFHTGHAQDIQLGLASIAAAHAGLKRGGKLFMVANRHLPYESRLEDLFFKVEKTGEANGFKCHLCVA